MRSHTRQFSRRVDFSIQVRVTLRGKRRGRLSPVPIGWIVCVFLLTLSTGVGFCQQPAAAPAGAPVPAQIPEGQAIFDQRCASCHGVAGQGRSGVIGIAGPSLQAEHNRGAVMTAVEVGPSHMPTFSYVLTVPEIRAVADYVTQQIAVIPLSGGNMSEGANLFGMYCAVCHRTVVRGGALAFTGVNAPALTNKSAALVAGAIRWGPGPMPAFPEPVLSDQQLASIVDYVKFVQHPPSPGGSPMNFFGPVAEGFMGFIAIFVLIAFTMGIEKGGKG